MGKFPKFRFFFQWHSSVKKRYQNQHVDGPSASNKKQERTQTRFYTHDVTEIYLKPIASVPGSTFAAPGTDVIGVRWISNKSDVDFLPSMLFFGSETGLKLFGTTSAASDSDPCVLLRNCHALTTR